MTPRGRRRAGLRGSRHQDEPRAIYATSAARRRRRARRRRAGWAAIALVIATLVLLALIVLTIAGGGDDDGDQGRSGVVLVVAQGRTVARGDAVRLARLGAGRFDAWVRRLPGRWRERRRRAALVTLETDRSALARAVRRAARAGGGTVGLPERAVAARAHLPVVKQALRNNCETAALSMLLAATGVKVDQLRLQRQLPRSGPLDPRPAGPLPVWGDPDEGFVGRPNGGGTSGGYGVYPSPVRALARRQGVALRDLSGSSPRVIYRSLLAGRPVIAWVGLSEGPYKSWRTPAGKRVRGNFGEHTVVLTGLRGDRLAVNDPLYGVRANWRRADFELMWRRLGRRALAL